MTQTFDPQSPPCIAAWDDTQGNGGATTKGVSASTIKLAVPGGVWPGLRHYIDYFNSHFQFYGRKMQLVEAEYTGDPIDVAVQRAAAEAVAATAPFATLGLSNRSNEQSQFLGAVAAEKVVATTGFATQNQESQLAAWHPYVWSYSPLLDEQELNASEFTCKALHGKPARFAQDPQLTASTRSFALISIKPTMGERPVNLAPLRQNLAACGIEAEVFELEDESAAEASSVNAQTMLSLKQSGVTTAIFVGNPGSFALIAAKDASRAGYHPEWLVIGTGDNHDSTYGIAPADQRGGLFGLTWWNKQINPAERPEDKALKEQRSTEEAEDVTYKSLLLLASGIQAAGPRLSGESFAAGLRDLRFPNPGAGRSPSWQATVDIPDDAHSMMRDQGLWWWSETARNDDSTGSGGYCYVGRGTRWTRNTWPADDPGLFDRSKGC